MNIRIRIGFVSAARRHFRQLAERLAEMCRPRIKSQVALRGAAIAGPAASGYVRAWASLAIHEVAAMEPLPGLDQEQWRELIELATQRVVESEIRPAPVTGGRAWRRAA